jgi:hypothetical protein
LSFVKGDRYRISGKHYNAGGATFLAVSLVRKSETPAWNSISGEEQTVVVKYPWIGDVLRLDLGDVVEGKYKLSYSAQPHGQSWQSGGLVDYWIDAKADPIQYLRWYLPSNLRDTYSVNGTHTSSLPYQLQYC